MVEEEESEEEDMDEDSSSSEDVKEERDQLNKLGVSDTWEILTKPE